MNQVWERLRSELVEIIEWSETVPGAPDPASDTLAWRFSATDNPLASSTIRNGSQLIVREGQWAVFLDEGRIADGFGPGRHTLSTANLPLLTSLLCLPTGFESPFRAEVVFVSTRLLCDLRWGTRQPLLIRDPELGPIRLRGFGSYSLRVADPSWLVREVSGARGCLSLETLRDPLRQLIVSRLAELLGGGSIPVFDLAGRYGQLAGDLRLSLVEDLLQYGLEMPSLLIEGLSLPAEVEAALDRRSSRILDNDALPPLSPPPLPPPLPGPLPGPASASRPPSTGEAR